MPLIPKVAHEGNPRRSTLDIPGGSLLSDPIRTVTASGPLPGGVGADVGGPIEEPAAIPVGSSSDGSKYEFSVDAQNNITFVFGNTGFEDPAGWVKEHSFRSGTPMYGFISYHALGAANSGPLPLPTDLDFHGLVEWVRDNLADTSVTVSLQLTATILDLGGTAILGLACGVHPDSTSDEFFGYACAFDSSTNILYILRYNGEPLTSLGTIIASEVVTAPAIGNSMTFALNYHQNNGDPNFEAFPTFTSSSIGTGFIAVPDDLIVPGVGAAVIDIATSATHNAVENSFVTWESVNVVTTTD